jgi:RNA polymerase sigma factor for flagellar operon FliA
MPDSISNNLRESKEPVKGANKTTQSATRSDKMVLRNKMIVEYRGFVEIVVTRLIRSMGLPVSMKDDFISAGYVGLVEAAGRFDADRGYEFKTYAYQRIRGAIIDHIRTSCDLKGHAYRKFKALESAHDVRSVMIEDAGRKGQKPQKQTQDAVNYLHKVAVGFTLAVQNDDEAAVSPEQEKQDPEKLLEKKRTSEKIKEIVATLPEKERTIIEQYYFRDQKFVDIATNFGGFSKSWVSRLHDRALEMLRTKIEEHCQDMAA